MVITYIEKYRRAYLMTKTALANKVGVSCMAVSQWESGRVKPGTDAALKMAQIFRCDPKRILEVEDLSEFGPRTDEPEPKERQNISDDWED